MNRRDFIKVGSSGLVLLANPMVTACAKSKQPKKLIWVMLRGAMDSLHAVVPSFDKNLKPLRRQLLNPIENKLLPLDRGFGLHPELSRLHQWYKQKQMLPVVAVASPYRSRSHFDAQDLLESGLDQKKNYDSGWLGRALSQYQGDALAISPSLPISLLGSKKTRTWYPSTLPSADEGIYQRLAALYQKDELLKERLNEGVKTRSMLNIKKANKVKHKFAELTSYCGELLSSSPTINCAMLEMGGWDTHRGQVNGLNRQFKSLDSGLFKLKEKLGKEWENTLVVVATEFGRTVRVNGTFGTDHGTASALFLAGGAVNGGQVLGEWPGLAPKDLYEGRDLRPTSDIRSWLATVLQQHWQLNPSQIDHVFPGIKAINHKIVV